MTNIKKLLLKIIDLLTLNKMSHRYKFFTTREDTEVWLHKMDIKNYTINDDLIVDVNGSVDLNNGTLRYNKFKYDKLKYIPVQFGKISGDFSCANNRLTSLKGSPKRVGGDFSCSHNQLTSLAHVPQKVEGDFFCYNNPITNFSYLEFEVKGQIMLTPIEEMEYLNRYKFIHGYKCVKSINFNEFKKHQELINLNKKLNNDLQNKPNVKKLNKI